jgi:opacity protein-like surface antigen
MRSSLLLVALAALAFAAAPAPAQSGFALKGHYLYNASALRGADRIPSADGFSVGAEMVLPGGLGIGISGYTVGEPREFDTEASSVFVVAEALYFLGVPLLPVSPYVGVHGGLGRVDRGTLEDGTRLSLRDRSRSQLGYQAGLRVRLMPQVGLDAQYRRVSLSAFGDQDGSLERNQWLLGVTLF